MRLKMWELASHERTGSVGLGKLYAFPEENYSTSLLFKLMSYPSELHWRFLDEGI